MAARNCVYFTVTTVGFITSELLIIMRPYCLETAGFGSAPSWAHVPVGDPPDDPRHDWYAPTTTVGHHTPSPTLTLPPTPALSLENGAAWAMVMFGSILMGCLLSMKKYRTGHQHSYMVIDHIFPTFKIINRGLARTLALSLWLFRAYEDSWYTFCSSFWWATTYLGLLFCDIVSFSAEYLGLIYPFAYFASWFAICVIQ
ncbi:hypothetical protein BKA62DRAFT_771987 [Auriculariales sp. MPI-PUGE-AT-0066]|nr:hypothetical protein BKA62DRAFT_771987 [Auriculariales sp. MPI-PUGE-AT-0066]